MSIRKRCKPHYGATGMLVGLSLLPGCAPGVREPRLMLLSNDIPPAAVAAAARPQLTIRGVRLPEYLDRRSVMYRASPTELKAFPDVVWAEKPGTAVTRWLAQELAARLPAYDVRSYSAGDVPGYALETEIAGFEASAPAAALRLRGTWRIAEHAAWGGTLDIAEPLAELSPEASVEAMKSALQDAAGQIAARVRSLPPPALDPLPAPSAKP